MTSLGVDVTVAITTLRFHCHARSIANLRRAFSLWTPVGGRRERCDLTQRADAVTAILMSMAKWSSKVVGRDLSILRKEVIQPQVPLRLPCYDLVPITGFIFGACLAAPATSDAPRFGGLTGGVYKAQEPIHRSMLICDY